MAQALAAIGKPAVPSLLEVLQKEDDPSLRSGCLRPGGARTTDRAHRHTRTDRGITRQGREGPQRRGLHPGGASPGNRQGVTGLVEFAKHAASILPRIGKEALPALVEAPRDKQGRFQARVALVIDGIAPTTEGLVPALVAAMRDPDVDVRILAAQALGRMGERVVPDLIAALEDTDAEMRRLSGATLGSMGPAARAAVPALIKHSKSKTDGWWAAEAVLRIDPKAAAAAGITEGN